MLLGCGARVVVGYYSNKNKQSASRCRERHSGGLVCRLRKRKRKRKRKPSNHKYLLLPYGPRERVRE